MKLGRREPKNAPRLKLANFLKHEDLKVAVPPQVNYIPAVTTYGLYQNDSYGVCGPAALSNYLKLVTTILEGTPFTATQADVFDLYRRSDNPTFDPLTGAGDNGVDMQTMLEAALSGGIGGRRPFAFASVDVNNHAEIKAAIAIFGGVLLGVDLQTAQSSSIPWDYVVGSEEWGGHAVFAGAYDSDGLGVVSWGSPYDTTESFISHRLLEAWVVIFPEHLGTRAFLEGVDLNELADSFEALTGKPFPSFATEPTPYVPPGQPSPADVELASAVRQWATKRRHVGEPRVVAEAVRKWLTAKGLTAKGL
jgi:hypothetical protein